MKYSKKDLLTYLLVYAASADFTVSEEEMETIVAKVGKEDYHTMKSLFDEHNDIQSINFIEAMAEEHNLSQVGVEGMFAEIKAVFLADGHYDLLEKQLEMRLRHILGPHLKS